MGTCKWDTDTSAARVRCTRCSGEAARRLRSTSSSTCPLRSRVRKRMRSTRPATSSAPRTRRARPRGTRYSGTPSLNVAFSAAWQWRVHDFSVRQRNRGTGHIPCYIGAALMDVDDVVTLEELAESDTG